jgi:hypothetical protein
MQRGHLCRAHGAWHLRYRVNGKQVSVKLAHGTDEYRTLKSVRPLAERFLQPVDAGQRVKEMSKRGDHGKNLTGTVDAPNKDKITATLNLFIDLRYQIR